MFPSVKTWRNQRECEDRNVKMSISTMLGKHPCGGPEGAGEFYRARSASWVTRESPQLQPLKELEAIFKKVKLRSLGALGGWLAPTGHLQISEAAEVRLQHTCLFLPWASLGHWWSLLCRHPWQPRCCQSSFSRRPGWICVPWALDPAAIPLT